MTPAAMTNFYAARDMIAAGRRADAAEVLDLAIAAITDDDAYLAPDLIELRALILEK